MIAIKTFHVICSALMVEIMIITKTPLRVSFLGGGTDFPIFINNNNFGCVISTTIDKFIYISIKKHGELLTKKLD